jgi:hypothetical protein
MLTNIKQKGIGNMLLSQVRNNFTANINAGAEGRVQLLLVLREFGL